MKCEHANCNVTVDNVVLVYSVPFNLCMKHAREIKLDQSVLEHNTEMYLTELRISTFVYHNESSWLRDLLNRRDELMAETVARTFELLGITP